MRVYVRMYECSDDEGSDDGILSAATNLNDIRRSLLRETADFVAKFRQGMWRETMLLTEGWYKRF